MEEKIREFEEWKKQYRDQMKVQWVCGGERQVYSPAQRDFHDYKESVFTELRQQQMGRERMQEVHCNKYHSNVSIIMLYSLTRSYSKLKVSM